MECFPFNQQKITFFGSHIRYHEENQLVLDTWSMKKSMKNYRSSLHRIDAEYWSLFVLFPW